MLQCQELSKPKQSSVRIFPSTESRNVIITYPPLMTSICRRQVQNNIRHESFTLIHIIRKNFINVTKIWQKNRNSLHHHGSSNEIIQIYIEPKGQAFVCKDQWKEDLLDKIKPADLIVEDDDVRLYGVKFYTGDNRRKILNELETLRSNRCSKLVKAIEEEFENLL